MNMLLRNSGIRDIATVLHVVRACVLNQLLKQAVKSVISPKQKHYKSVQIEEFWSNNLAAFAAVLSGQNHQVGKDLTRHIERQNNAIRVRNTRFARKIICFSKKDKYHEAAIKVMFQQRNYD